VSAPGRPPRVGEGEPEAGGGAASGGRAVGGWGPGPACSRRLPAAQGVILPPSLSSSDSSRCPRQGVGPTAGGAAFGGSSAGDGGGGGGGHFGGGGGGSSFVIVGATGVTHSQGVRAGDGEVTISW
jgi:hypothetical protein